MLRVLGNGCVNAIHPAPFDELPVIDRLIELHGLTPFIIQSMSRRWVCQEATQSFFGHPIRGMCGCIGVLIHYVQLRGDQSKAMKPLKSKTTEVVLIS